MRSTLAGRRRKKRRGDADDRPRTPLTPSGRVRHALELAGARPDELAAIDGALARWGGRTADLVAAYRSGLEWRTPNS